MAASVYGCSLPMNWKICLHPPRVALAWLGALLLAACGPAPAAEAPTAEPSTAVPPAGQLSDETAPDARPAEPRVRPNRPPNPLPNLLIVQPDQLGAAFLGCSGDEAALTPNIDRLAREGVRFTCCASASPRCTPFRATFQTGLYAHRSAPMNGDRLPAEFTTLGERLSAAGYRTGYAGKWHLDGNDLGNVFGGWVPPERRQGWSEWTGHENGHSFFEVQRFDEEQSPPKLVPVEGYEWEPTFHTDVAIDFMRRHSEAGTPWAYYLAYGPPHNPPECPDEYLAPFQENPPPLSRHAGDLNPRRRRELEELTRTYYAQIHAIDFELGRLLAELERLGIADDTLVLFTSDHGDRMGDHIASAKKLRGKGTPHRRAYHIPWIMRWPERIAAERELDFVTSSIDFYPTLLTLAGLEHGEVDGLDLSAWCRPGEVPEGPARESVYLSIEGRRGWRAAWTGDVLLSRGEYEVLYDYRRDPHELENLFGHADYAEVQRELTAELERFRIESDDVTAPR